MYLEKNDLWMAQKDFLIFPLLIKKRSENKKKRITRNEMGIAT
jgi:hypothetical protein